MKRIAILATAVALVLLALWAGVGDLLSLDTLKDRREELAEIVERRPLPLAALYFLIYVGVTALSIPGATIVTLAGGAVFGLVFGVVLVSFASVLGAVIAFLGSRYLFRGWVERRFGRRLAAIDRGIERDGTFYLLFLRLNPAVPYFLVNLGMGLTRIGVLRFALVSQIGMLPATIVYVNAGTQIARIRSVGDIASPSLIGSLILLSLFPLLGKFTADRLKKRRIYRGWRRPRRFDRNLIVIGAGAGGLVTSYIAAAARAKVTLVEAGKMGGDCLNTGCVPSKALIRSARLAHEMRTAGRYGLTPSEPEVSLSAVMQRVRDIIREIEPADSVERYTRLGVDVRAGHAMLVDPWTVAIDGERLTARSIVIAAGAEPFIPEIPGLAEAGYLTSDTMWDALAGRDSPPARFLVIGGGPIGVEMAQAFARLGSRVCLVEAGDRILPREGAEVSATIAGLLTAEGVDIRTGHAAVRCEDKRLVVRAGAEESAIAFDDLLVAVGRRPRLRGYGLEALGIDTARPLETNGWLETAFPNIYAVGDVAGPYQFTHAAAHQAWHAAVNALFGGVKRFRVDYSTLPWVTFTDPEVAHVGHNEESARAAGIAYEPVRYQLERLDRAVAESAGHGFVKILVQPGKDRILGATIVGHNAGELIAGLTLAMKHRIGLGRLLGTVHAYPTMAEANKMAAGEWRRAHQPERLLAWAERYHRWRRR
ncbi:MAG TPA: FAD-dependent oxidoreductase [Allosphingosinicella sp.]|nr:FAD-dependent oxidoreductase [Allosphingosinicella sp.]